MLSSSSYLPNAKTNLTRSLTHHPALQWPPYSRYSSQAHASSPLPPQQSTPSSSERGRRSQRRLSQALYVSIPGTRGDSPLQQRTKVLMRMFEHRASIIQSTTASSSPAIRAFHTPSQQMDITRRHITERFQTVRSATRIFLTTTLMRFIASDPACPQAIMQFQHGTVVMNSDLSLSLSPFSVDGRQLFSDPCASSKATYSRYNQTETMAVRSPPSPSNSHPEGKICLLI